MSSVPETLGRRLRQRRRLLDLTQADVADRCGVAFQTVQKWEAAENELSVSRLLQVARALGVSPGSLIEGL